MILPNLSNNSLEKAQLIKACEVGDLATIKEIINKYHTQNDDFLNKAFCYSARYNLESVQYLLTSPELKFHPDFNFNHNNALYESLVVERIDIVSYLLTSPELEKHPFIHDNDDICFTNMCSIEKYSVIEYLIFDYGIEKTSAITQFLKDWPNPLVENMFKKRDLNQELNKELTQKHNQSDKKKNKL